MARRKKGGKKLTGVQRDARRDVMVANQPYLNDLRRSGKQARRITKRTSRRTSNIYKALGNQLAPLSGQYSDAVSGISGDLAEQLAGFTGMLGSEVPGVPSGEIAAGTGLFGTIGAGTMQDLASQQARNVGYNTSAQRQGAIESAVAQRNYQKDLRDYLLDLNSERRDFKQGLAPMIQSRADELSRIAFDQMMAQRDYELRKLSANRAFNLSQQEMNQLNQSNSALEDYLAWKYGQQAGR